MIEQLLGSRPFQIGIVVRDVRETAARYSKPWNIEDWMIVENGPQNMHGVQHSYGFGVDGSGAFAYFDTEAELGCLLEAIEPLNE